MTYPTYVNPYSNPYAGQPYPMAAPQYQPPAVPRTPATSPQAVPPTNLFGRMVTDISEVTPQEVPMNGSVSFFPTNDYKAVYAKCWSPDGTIQTFKFVPEQQLSQEPQSDPFDEIKVRLDKIEESLNRRNNYNKNKRQYNNESGENNGD